MASNMDWKRPVAVEHKMRADSFVRRSSDQLYLNLSKARDEAKDEVIWVQSLPAYYLLEEEGQ